MIKKNTSLKTKTTVGLIFIGILSVLSLVIIFKTIVKDEIALIEQNVIEKDGKSIVAGVAQQLSSVTQLVHNLAQLANQLPKDKNLYFKIVPLLLGNNNKLSHIAGGGIWPEPFEFDEKIKRRSFFWGREPTGALKYYEDYNAPKGKGYHHEEWYIPAKFINTESTYWSRSYMDPYSSESMVTATVPYTNHLNKFAGVATVDIKLSGLNKLFKKHAKHNKGYVFAVDRNGVLISFPESSEIKPYKIENNKPVGEYFTLKHIAKKYKGFSIYENHIDEKRKEYLQNSSNNYMVNKISSMISDESYKINKAEAIRIATNIKIKPSTNYNQYSSILYIDYDPVLKTDAIASIHYLPKYNWFVAIVTPRSIMMSKVNNTTKVIFIWILVILFLTIILIYAIFHKIIIKPLKLMESTLEGNINSHYNNPIPIINSDELGQLATLFNQHSEMIEKSRIEADKANNAKSEFLSRMSHELRTPLNAIIGFSQLLEMDNLKDENNLENIREILKAGYFLLLLINDLIDLSRIESKTDSLDIKPYKINTLLLDTIKLIKPIQDECNITINTDIEGCKNIPVLVDVTAIKQVFLNLINNAIKYNKINGHLQINCKQDRSFLQIDFKDTGIGIPEKQLGSIFEPFNRVGKEYSTVEGSGIGLYVTKNFIKEMKGEIVATSIYNEGSTFTIRLPVSVIDEYIEDEVINETENTIITITTHNINVLIVEDIKSNQKLLQTQISRFGMSSGVAYNGVEALELLNKYKYDIVLTDCTMPIMDGYELASEIRSSTNNSISQLPIIAITADARIEIEKKCLDAGMNAYFTKPIDLNKLQQKMQEYLNFD